MRGVQHGLAVGRPLGLARCRVRLFLTSCATRVARRSISSATSSTSKACARASSGPTAHTEALRAAAEEEPGRDARVYVPGNHDEDLRALVGVRFGNIEVAAAPCTRRAAGRRLLVLHGDEFDALIKCSALAGRSSSAPRVSELARLESASCIGCTSCSSSLLVARATRQGANRQRGSATSSKFQRASLRAAADGGFDGVVCGHIHKADARRARRSRLLQRRRLGRELHGARRGPATASSIC